MLIPAQARRAVGSLAIIALAVGAGAAAFAYTAGWLSADRLTPARMVDALSRRGGDPLGHRRNHAKGICFTGELEANGAGARLSTAPMFAAGHYPVIGRFAIAVGNPGAPDGIGRVRSMAVRIVAPGGEEWRSGMNNSPVFVVSTPEAFYKLTLVQGIDPRTGRPEPDAMQHFLAAHPESAPFFEWAKTAPWTASYADQTYNSLNAFHFIDAGGHGRLVRWSMHPIEPLHDVLQAELAALGPDFLEQDLKRRLAQGPLRWRLVVTLAATGDPSSDATKPWPDNRERLDIGTLVVERAEDEADGQCRDYNFDPTILPVGIKPSDDPLLAARSSAYTASFDLRTEEEAHYPRTSQHPGEAR